MHQNLHYLDLMVIETVVMDGVAPGRPYHAAFVRIGAREAPSRPHTHTDLAEMFYVLAGRGIHRVGSTSQRLEAGDLALVRRSDEHAFAAAAPAELQFVNIAFPAAAWQDFLALTNLDAAARWDRQPLPPHTRVPAEQTGHAETVFARALARFDEEATSLDLIRFWVEAVALLDQDEPGADSGPPEWLTQACNTLRAEENLREGLPRLLDLAAVSHGYLDRCMRRYFNMTPTEYITALRLRHAAALLGSTSNAIGEIAQRCGFTSQSYFTRRFHDAYGTSPRQYRNQARRLIIP
jgi:AraC-like DNA-binding protein/quercetin dioxygenase-like cupin family protein